MKKTLTTLFGILFPLFTFCQIVVNDVSQSYTKIGSFKYSDFNRGKLEYTIIKGDTVLSLSYYDQRYPNLQSTQVVTIKGGKLKAKELQNVLLSFYNEENLKKEDYTINFKIDEVEFTASKMRKRVMLMIKDKGYVDLDKGNITSLFGK